jgi:hypothetical protein
MNFLRSGSLRRGHHSEKPHSDAAMSFADSWSARIRLVLRFLQIVFALTVCGLYGTDLDAARKAHKYADRNWVFAVVVAGLSIITAFLLTLPLVKAWWFAWWDSFLLLLWIIVFGIFGKMYINEDAEGNKGIQRMKNAVWIDLLNCFLWLATSLYGAWIWRRYLRQRDHPASKV